MSSFKDICVLIISSVLLILFPPANPTHFRITSFDSGSNDIIYDGAARPLNGAVEFNSATDLSQVGRATYANSVQVWDANTGNISDFSTHFSFTIDTQNHSVYGDGLAFFLAPIWLPIPTNSVGQYLGLFNTTTANETSQNQIVFVEFDSFPNPEWDPDFQHVGINVNALYSANFVKWNAGLYSNQISNAWINYSASTKNLSILLTYSNSSSSQDSYYVSHIVDITKILPEWVTIGFSAATGSNIERHSLNFWEFNSTLNLKVKLAEEKNVKRVILTTGLVVSAGLLICGVGVAWFVVKRKNKTKIEKEMANLTSITSDDFERGVGPKKFSYGELSSATDNFLRERKLGEGGFGAVYRGLLNDTNLDVAVKRISRGSKQGKREYVTEVKIISRLRHRNLVQLIGWCHEQHGEFLLVYEFMPNCSLDTHLFGKKDSLCWEIRYKISLGLASALFYLHEELEQCVVHRDIKSSNVMLDSNFNAKLGDFGLATLMDHELGHQTTGLAGTWGYMAPEYIRTGKA
ncbi:Lectin receptor kinase, partial [Thalictrum thalictroides]